MRARFLYQTPILPSAFEFPQSFLTVANRTQQPDLIPWQFLFLDMPRSLSYFGAMLQKYTDKPLIPFAIVDDKTGLYNGGFVVLACFDGDDKIFQRQASGVGAPLQPGEFFRLAPRGGRRVRPVPR